MMNNIHETKKLLYSIFGSLHVAGNNKFDLKHIYNVGYNHSNMHALLTKMHAYYCTKLDLRKCSITSSTTTQ